MQPHRQQPTRVLCPWDSLGKKTEVGCHFLLQRSSQARDWTCVSASPALAGRSFTTVPPGKLDVAGNSPLVTGFATSPRWLFLFCCQTCWVISCLRIFALDVPYPEWFPSHQSHLSSIIFPSQRTSLTKGCFNVLNYILSLTLFILHGIIWNYTIFYYLSFQVEHELCVDKSVLW